MEKVIYSNTNSARNANSAGYMLTPDVEFREDRDRLNDLSSPYASCSDTILGMMTHDGIRGIGKRNQRVDCARSYEAFSAGIYLHS